MEASCATPELAKQAIPKLKRLWKARNELSSKLSERRAMLRREGIIDHCVDGASCEQEQEDEDGSSSEDGSSELSVWCNGEKKSIVRDKVFSKRSKAPQTTQSKNGRRRRSLSRSLERSKGPAQHPEPRARTKGNAPDPFELWRAGEAYIKLQKFEKEKKRQKSTYLKELQLRNSFGFSTRSQDCSGSDYLKSSSLIMSTSLGKSRQVASMSARTVYAMPGARAYTLPAFESTSSVGSNSGKISVSMSTQSLRNLFKRVWDDEECPSPDDLDENNVLVASAVHDRRDSLRASRTHLLGLSEVRDIRDIIVGGDGGNTAAAAAKPASIRAISVGTSDCLQGPPGAGIERRDNQGFLSSCNPNSRVEDRPMQADARNPALELPRCGTHVQRRKDSLRIPEWRRSSIQNPEQQARRLSLKLTKLVDLGLLEAETKLNMSKDFQILQPGVSFASPVKPRIETNKGKKPSKQNQDDEVQGHEKFRADCASFATFSIQTGLTRVGAKITSSPLVAPSNETLSTMSPRNGEDNKQAKATLGMSVVAGETSADANRDASGEAYSRCQKGPPNITTSCHISSQLSGTEPIKAIEVLSFAVLRINRVVAKECLERALRHQSDGGGSLIRSKGVFGEQCCYDHCTPGLPDWETTEAGLADGAPESAGGAGLWAEQSDMSLYHSAQGSFGMSSTASRNPEAYEPLRPLADVGLVEGEGDSMNWAVAAEVYRDLARSEIQGTDDLSDVKG